MKTKEKLILFTILIITLILILLPNTTNAALQSNDGTPKTDTINNWLMNIRQMQATGGTLGLTDTINSNLTSNNKNLDIHMEKNTEYGALVILSASSYGKPDKVGNGETTTGNATGVKMNINKEWVSAGCSTLNVTNFSKAAGRYKNIYTTNYSAKKGDAILNWHSSTSSRWISFNNGSGLLRSHGGSIFSYYGIGDSGDNDARFTKYWYTRAVIVVGSEI